MRYFAYVYTFLILVCVRERTALTDENKIFPTATTAAVVVATEKSSSRTAGDVNERTRHEENPESGVKRSARNAEKIKFDFENGSASCY